MNESNNILQMIKNAVHVSEPEATVILFGSFARGDQKDSSDIDLLILLNKDEIKREDEKRVKYPLYEIEFETGQIISPIVLSKRIWNTRHRITPFFSNIMKEGRIL